MKFQAIYALEFRYQLRRPATWIYFVALLVIAYLIVIPCILIIAPKVQWLVDLFFKEKGVSNGER